ncbi:sodium/potassium/calcium exchanger 5-like isoform X2 [Varroa destructor]|uniref:Sodium/calcium exchanger membrane region domain-containing protein n=1 Tax=Varroa destructor TaxID=109461 RepID=A0A7M7KIN3_VARDE|nr:sodium/potassium/calcium exchanger 5-like isoform X2 [Varroa destructor]
MGDRLHAVRTYRNPMRKHVIIPGALLLAHVVFAAVNHNEPTYLSSSIHPLSNIYHENGVSIIGSPLENCTPAAVEQFPKPMLTIQQRRRGWLAVHIIVAIYMFAALSTLCEEYFVPAIEVLTESLQIDLDVAGATFMAAASSVPAIAASIIAILVAKGDLGVSTALGSAVLNAAGVVSVSALFAGKVVTLHRWPMYRDSLFFLISVIVMLIAMYDDLITWYEATILVACYFIYAIFMSFDAKLEAFFVKRFSFLQDRVDYPEGMFPAQATTQDASAPVPTTISTKEFDSAPQGSLRVTERRLSLNPYRKSIVELPPSVRVLLEGQRRRMSLISLKRSSVVNEQIIANEIMKNQVMAAVAASSRGSEGSLDVDLKSPLKPPRNHFLKIFWLFYLPFTMLFHLTIPNCQRKKCRKWFLATFIMSTFYITLASYLLVWMITIIGFTLSISDTVMGLTFLSIGVTLPDIVSSLLVVRKGFGDMAVCNALGSNIFEILVGLGLPWLIKTAVIEPGIPILVESKGMMYSTISLLLTLFFLIALTHWNRWRMSRLYGAILMTWYIAFLILSTLYELGIFGNPRQPMCSSNY